MPRRRSLIGVRARRRGERRGPGRGAASRRQEILALDADPHEESDDFPRFESLTLRQQQALRDGMNALLETCLLELMEQVDVEKFVFKQTAMAVLIPPRYHHRCDLGFARRLLVALICAMERLRDSESPRCVAEEMAFQGIIDFTRDRVVAEGDRNGETAEETVEGIEAYGDCLLEDADFELLWEPRFDGIEDERVLGMVNLAFDGWFKPFRRDRPVHPFLQVE